MNWNRLKTEEQVDQIREESKSQPVLIFKHSSRCSISKLALDRLEKKWNEADSAIKPYFLDLITFRDTSNRIARQFEVEHESPQALVIKDGRAVYEGSHFSIDYNAILEAAKS